MDLRLSELKVQPFLIITRKGEISYQSSGFAQIFFPIKSGDLIEEYLHPEDRKEFLAWFRSLAFKEPEAVSVKHLRFAHNSGRIVSVMVRPERIGPNEFIFWCWEDNLLKEEGDYWDRAFTPAMEALFSSILDGAFLVNIEGKLIAVNQALCDLLGYHNLELIGLPVGRLFSEDAYEIQKATRRFGLIMKYGSVREVNLTLKNRAGEEIEVSFNGAVIRGEGNQLVGILATVRDLRESKLMRQLREKTEKLEQVMEALREADKVKDDFLSLVGHELRTPLSNILGYAEFLAEGNLEEKEKWEFHQVIYQESRRLARLVNEILDLSRLEAGRLVYHYVLQPLDPVLEEAISSLQVEAEQRRIQVHLDFGFGRELWFDRDRIKQVMMNLVSNALKYSDPGKEVWVQSKEVDQGALVSVKDQGIGIAQENLKKVFDKFHRVEDLEHHSQGAGLGLPIAKRIIEEGHQGRIWLESEGLGKGSTFYFWIPKIPKNGT